jgi:hypothetical protein
VGYSRKELQILGGGFNLLPPGDKTPATDYLLAQNWRVDRVGKLVSRWGYPLKFAIPGGGLFAHSAGVRGGVEGDYYVGANGTGANPGAVYFALNATPIANGFDGGRIAFVPQNGWMWMMNRGVQGKHNPYAGFHNYGIAAPANACTAAAGAADPAGPSGDYQYYVTFQTADQSVESNPSPVSNTVTVAGQDVNLTAIPVSADPQVGIRNVYATGGTLGQAYQVGTINDNVTTTFAVTISDLDATDNGVAMPTTNDGPPAASGMAGPYFSRLLAWSTAEHSNRLYWTDPNLPQYWPGSADEAIGNWVDVGAEGEAIVWCTMHAGVFVIYKERSIWWLVGDPDTGTLDQVTDAGGLTGQWAVTAAGAVDYFVGPNGLMVFTTAPEVKEGGPAVAPLFNSRSTNAGPLTPPGQVLPGSVYSTNSLFCYGVALGYAMGKLYVSYAEKTTGAATSVLLVYHEASQRWFYHRNGIGTVGFQGFFFDGVEMTGLTGNGANLSMGLNVDDFRAFATADYGGSAIECVYQSHYEDAGKPDVQKVWLEVVVDYELAGDSATVYVGLDNGNAPLTAVGTITGTARKTTGFALAFSAAGALVIANPADSTQTPCLAKNFSVAIDCVASNQVIIHNVYLYYYEEARLALAASTIPTDLGSGKVKQCKELQLDIDASGGAVNANLYSDLPGNLLTVRQTPALAKTGGRALWKFPFPTTEGYLWRLALTAAAGAFRLYSARLLMRVIGVYVEAYESAAGFVWDSMELTFDSGITHIPKAYQLALAALPIKRAREISLEIETFSGDVIVRFLSDLPGDAQAVRFTATINTGTAGRRFMRIPLPAGTLAPIEGRLFRLQLAGVSKFILYQAAVEILAVGVYIEAYEAAGGAVWDSREMDFTVPAVKEARELELDIETTGSVGVQLLSDLSTTYTGAANTTGRQKVMLPLTINAALDQFVEGRLLRLLLSGTNAFRLYGARVRIRAFGQYITAGEGALWDTTVLDLGSQTVKQLREIELDIWAYGAYTVTVYTDLPGNAMTSRVVSVQAATGGRRAVQIPLPQGSVPDNYLYGRLVRVTLTSSSAVKLFAGRIHSRAIGVYVESYEAAGGAVWDSTPSDLGSPSDKTFDQVRIEMDSDGAATVAVYTDLPGESFALRGTFALTNGATSRHWATVPLPAAVEGRSVRLVASSVFGFRIYKAQVRAAQVGRYLCGATASGASDSLTTLEFDFRSERVKIHKKIEVDLRADSAVTLVALTEQGGMLAQVYTQSLTTPNGRALLRVTFPPGIRGRLLRLSLTGGPARVYHLRCWCREVNEPGAKWDWEDYPLEESDVLPKWSDLPVPETPAGFAWSDLPVTPTTPEWQWAPFPVNPTEAQYFFAKVLPVEETDDVWTWVDLDVGVSGG